MCAQKIRYVLLIARLKQKHGCGDIYSSVNDHPRNN